MFNRAKIKFLTAALLLAGVLYAAPALALKISEATDRTAAQLTTSSRVPVGVSGDSTAYSTTVEALKIYAITSLSTVCDAVNGGGACSATFGYADPRWYGAYCSSNYNTNNATQDDSVGIQAAINSNYPVRIPVPGCKLANKVNFTNDGQVIYGNGQGGRYNSNYPNRPLLFMPNNLWDNRATSLNCAIDTAGYDNVTLRNITMRANFNLVGSVGVCNSVGIQSGRGAAFINLENVAFLNMGNGVGAAMVSYFDDNGGSPYNGATPCTPISTDGGGYGAAIDLLNNNVFQLRAKGVDMIGSCMGMYGNFSDVHLSDFYGANINHNVLASLAGYGSAWDITLGRVEYSGFGAATNTVFVNDGAGMFFDGPFGVNVSNITCDHQYGSCIKTGPNARMINLNNINAIDSGYTSLAGITDKAHFVIDGTKGVQATNICTRRNAVATPYVLVTRNSPTYVRWEGCGGTTGTTTVGGWGTSYFNLVSTPSPFTYDVQGVGYSMAGTAATMADLTATKFVRGGSADTVAAGTGAGTSPTVTIAAGASGSGQLSVVTGTTAAGSNATIATITYNQACPNGSQVILSPANNAAAALAVGARPYATGTTTTAVVTSGATALADSTTYLWDYTATCR